MWRLTRTSDYSYPRVTTIWIDVHTTGKTWSTRHTLSTLDSHMSLDHMYLTWSAYNNLSLVINKVRWMHYSREKSVSNSTSKPDWVAHGTHPSFSPNTIIKAVRLSQTSVDSRLLGLLGLYHQYAISMFNTCSRRSTHRYLTDTGESYNLGGVNLPHHTL
jgi:hypothetical protein